MAQVSVVVTDPIKALSSKNSSSGSGTKGVGSFPAG